MIKDNTDKKAFLTATGKLQDFLDNSNEHDPREVYFELNPSVKDLFEAQGIPHTAVAKVEINGTKQDFSYNLQKGDRIRLYSYNELPAEHFNQIYTSPVSFIADVHLGKMTKTLRLLGLDCAFDNHWDDQQIIEHSNAGPRMILTRDLELLKNGDACYGYWIRSTDPDEQIKELFERFDLAERIDPFTRCMKCNGILQQTHLDKIENSVPPKVQQWHSDYWQCTNCKQVYWQGSHFKKLQQKVDKLTQ